MLILTAKKPESIKLKTHRSRHSFTKFVGMTAAIDIQPLSNELPSHFADRVGQLYAKTVTTQHKKDNGQFFTPTAIAPLYGKTHQTNKRQIQNT